MLKSVRKKLKSLKPLKGDDRDRMARLFEEIKFRNLIFRRHRC